LLPFEQRAGFVRRVVAALAAGETSLLNAIAAAAAELFFGDCQDGSRVGSQGLPRTRR
jgi:hypothetical protein